MRPTLLQFRSPKEQTGEFLNPNLTNDGRNLKYFPKTTVNSTFSRGQRWEHIRELACRTSYKVGPGCYNAPITTNKGKSPKIVKPSATLTNGWDYIYVGDSIIKKDRPGSRGFSSTMRSSKRVNTDTTPVSRSFFERSSTYPKGEQEIYEQMTMERTPQTYYNRPASVGRKRNPTAELIRETLFTDNEAYQNNRAWPESHVKNRSVSQERQRPVKARENVVYQNDDDWTINDKIRFRSQQRRMQSEDYGGR